MIIPISSDDLMAYLGAPQLEALRNQALAPGQPDPLPSVIQAVCTRIRMEVCSVYGPIEEDGVPEELKDAACHLCIETLFARIPGVELSPKQRRSADEARRFLNKVAQGQIIPSTARGRAISVERKRMGHTTKDQLKGL